MGRGGRGTGLTNDELRERIEAIADKASNYSEYAAPDNRFTPHLALDALKNGIREVRDDLVTLIVDAGGERPWWADVQA